MSGIDPFAFKHRGEQRKEPISSVQGDELFTSTVRFLDLHRILSARGTDVGQVEAVLPGGGESNPMDDEWINRAIAELLAEIREVEAKFEFPRDKQDQTDDWLLGVFAAAVGDEDVKILTGMWAGTAETVVTEPIDAEPGTVAKAINDLKLPGVDVESEGRANGSKVETFTVRGVVTVKALEEIAPDSTVYKVLKAVADIGKNRMKRIFSGSDLGSDEGEDDRQKVLQLFVSDRATPEKRRKALADVSDALLPSLKLVARERVVRKFIETRFDAGREFLDGLLGEPGLLSSGTKEGPLWRSLVPEPASLSEEIQIEGEKFEGYLVVPSTEPYRFDLIGGKSVKLEIDGDEFDSISADGKVLEAGRLHRIDIRPKGSQVRVHVVGHSFAYRPLNECIVYSTERVDRAASEWARLRRFVQFAELFDLGIEEVKLMGGKPDLGKALSGGLDTAARFRSFMEVHSYVSLKDATGIQDGALLRGLEKQGEGKADPWAERIASLFDQEPQVFKKAAESIGLSAKQLGSVDALEAVWAVVELQRRTGIPAVSENGEVNPKELTLKELAEIAKANIDVGFETTAKLRDHVRASGDLETWRTVAGAIFENVRTRKRDALLSYVRHRHGFDTVERLYEEFLLDPAVEPVVQTSRLKEAISAVQLFVQRCFLKLEKGVSPFALNREHWEWMKNYRVWEANRKIFLYPENWLEPEFRQGKTHLFQEFEGALLQEDITEDLVERQLYNYLRGLDDISHLEIVSMFCERDLQDPAGAVLHVIGRTAGMPTKFFYRTYSRQVWSPWVPVDASIEGDHVVASVWRGRFYILWVTFIEKTSPSQSLQDVKKINDLGGKGVEVLRPSVVVEAQLHWSQYFNGEWSETRASAISNPMVLRIRGEFQPQNISIHVSQGLPKHPKEAELERKEKALRENEDRRRS